MKLFFLIYFILIITLLSQTSSVVGTVSNQATNKAVPYVNIGVQGTYFGTSSNGNGKFKLVLKNGSYNLVVSCVGYKTKIIPVIVPTKEELRIKLKPIAIKLAEVTVSAKENPAYEIIRKAIANKEKNKEGLKNYYYNFYSKNVLNSGKEIVFIEEDVGEGFNDLSEKVVELKTELYKTENVSKKTFTKSDFNFFEKKIIDFTADSLKLGKFVFHLPLSKFAFDYYDYKLLGIKQSGKRNFYQVEVIPYSKIRPTFKGEILIDDSSYALTGLNLTMENRNLIPFAEFKMSVIQNLINYKNYWLPKYFNINVQYDMNYYHLISLDSAITSYVKVLNNFSINLSQNDSLLDGINRLADTSFNAEPEITTLNKMDSLRLYPLSTSEELAYQNIDSTKKIVSALRLGGIGGKYVKNAELENGNKKNKTFNFRSILSFINFQNNRVDGITLGLKHSDWIADTILNYSVSAGYSLARKDVNAKFSFYLPIKKSFIDGVELSGNYGTKQMNVYSSYPLFWNSIGVTLGFEDQFNYYNSKSGILKIEKLLDKNTSVKIGFAYEKQKPLEAKKYYSIFNSKRNVRTNPLIKEGTDNKIVLNFNSGKFPYKLHFMMVNGFTSQVEISSGAFGSDYNYTRINAAYQFHIRTMFNELFFSPYLGVFIEGSAIYGSYELQHLYTPQTALGFYSPFGTFKALQPYQLTGNKSIAVHLEHNWRKTFFDMLGIYLPVAWNLELTTGASLLGIHNSSSFLETTEKNIFYWEVYGGISGILGIININVAYNKYNNTVVRIGFSKFF